MKLLKLLILWLIGGTTYFLVEILWRGHSHWSMFIVGGFCFLLVGGLNNWIEWQMKFWKQVLLGLTCVTFLEFVAGVVVNLILGWQVWDYSNLPFNLMGQICPQFVILWIPLVIFAIIMDDYLRYWIFKEQKPTYTII